MGHCHSWEEPNFGPLIGSVSLPLLAGVPPSLRAQQVSLAILHTKSTYCKYLSPDISNNMLDFNEIPCIRMLAESSTHFCTYFNYVQQTGLFTVINGHAHLLMKTLFNRQLNTTRAELVCTAVIVTQAIYCNTSHLS